MRPAIRRSPHAFPPVSSRTVEAVRSDRATRAVVFDKFEERRVGQLVASFNHARSFTSMHRPAPHVFATVMENALQRRSPRSAQPTQPIAEGSCPCRAPEKARLYLCRSIRHARAFASGAALMQPRRGESLARASSQACLRRNAGISYVVDALFLQRLHMRWPRYRATCATQPAYPARP